MNILESLQMTACPKCFPNYFFKTENKTAPSVKADSSFLGKVAQLPLSWLRYDLLTQWLIDLSPSEFGWLKLKHKICENEASTLPIRNINHLSTMF